MKRIFLLIATNFAVLLLLSLVMQVFGIDDWLARRGTDYQSALVIAAIFGFGGAFVSLAISKWVAKRTMGVQVIEQPSSEAERWLVDTVRSHAQKAGHRHARSRHFRFARAQCLRHRRDAQFLAGGGEQRPAAHHASR